MDITRSKILLFNTASRATRYLFLTGDVLSLLFSLYLALQARNLFTSLNLGKIFSHKNVIRLKKIAFVIIASQIIGPLIEYLIWRSTLHHVTFRTSGVQLLPPLQAVLAPIPDLIIVGLALLVLAGVLKETKQMRDEQRLTI